MRSRGKVEELVSLSEDEDDKYLDYVLPDFQKPESKADTGKSRSVSSELCSGAETNDAGMSSGDSEIVGMESCEGSCADRTDQHAVKTGPPLDLPDQIPFEDPPDVEVIGRLFYIQPLDQECDFRLVLPHSSDPDLAFNSAQQSGIEMENGIAQAINTDPLPLQSPSQDILPRSSVGRNDQPNPMSFDGNDIPSDGLQDGDLEQFEQDGIETVDNGNLYRIPVGDSMPLVDAEENEESQSDLSLDPICQEDLSEPDREWGPGLFAVPVEAEDVVPYEGRVDEEDRLVSLIGGFYSECCWIETLRSSQSVLLEVLAGSGNPTNTIRHLRKEFATEYQGLEMIRIAWFLRCELPESGDRVPSWAQCRRLLELFEFIPGPEELLSIVLLAADRSKEFSTKRYWDRRVTVPKPGVKNCYVPMSGVDFILRFWDLKPEPVSLEDWLSLFTWPSLGQMQDSWEDIQRDYDERSRKQVRGAKVETR